MGELLYNLVLRQKAEKDHILSMSSVTRESFSVLLESLRRSLIKVVIGPRRSGKSTLAHQVLSARGEEYAYFNFEDEQLPNGVAFDAIETALTQVYPKSTLYFLDEIQVFPRWEQLLNRLERAGKRIVVSGSNSKLLSSELSSSLTGRHEAFLVFPFSFGEYCQVHSQTSGGSGGFKEYLRYGGFPDVVMNRVHPQNYLRELWDSIVLKDIVQRYKVRSVTELKAMLTITRDSFASKISYRSLERALLNRLSIATVAKFCSYAEDAYLLFALQNFSYKSRERVSADKKVYLIDNGFYTSMKVGGQEDLGKLLENFVFISLYRSGLKPNLDFFYYKTGQKREIDFLILGFGKPRSLIQVCWSLSSEATRQREFKSIVDAAEDLGVSNAMVITAQEKKVFSHQGIKVRAVPVVEFIADVGAYCGDL
ncbi:MAG: ATP-binding protein [Deltaproteobacteria bacterium]|nr:ATP-binding protein [Deltaproteobacteria bacterium]